MPFMGGEFWVCRLLELHACMSKVDDEGIVKKTTMVCCRSGHGSVNLTLSLKVNQSSVFGLLFI